MRSFFYWHWDSNPRLFNSIFSSKPVGQRHRRLGAKRPLPRVRLHHLLQVEDGRAVDGRRQRRDERGSQRQHRQQEELRTSEFSSRSPEEHFEIRKKIIFLFRFKNFFFHPKLLRQLNLEF